jgi:hypothetical protein
MRWFAYIGGNLKRICGTDISSKSPRAPFQGGYTVNVPVNKTKRHLNCARWGKLFEIPPCPHVS